MLLSAIASLISPRNSVISSTEFKGSFDSNLATCSDSDGQALCTPASFLVMPSIFWSSNFKCLIVFSWCHNTSFNVGCIIGNSLNNLKRESWLTSIWIFSPSALLDSCWGAASLCSSWCLNSSRDLYVIDLYRFNFRRKKRASAA